MADAVHGPAGKAVTREDTLVRLLERLRELRIASGQTQEQFSEAAGISYEYYQAVEAGRKRELRLSTLDRLAQAHGLELWELLAPAKPKSKTKRSTPRRDSAR